MSGLPKEGYMDDYLAEAWRGFRSNIATHLDAALEEGQMEDLSVTTAAGQTLTLTIEDDHVVIFAGDEVSSTANPDEAAFRVINIVRNSWQVVHPIFLDCTLVAVPKIEDNPSTPAPTHVPLLGTADSTEQLQQWVEASFQADLDSKLKVHDDGLITWKLRGPNALVVQVRNPHRIEMWTILAKEVDFDKAETAIHKLSNEYITYRFFLRQDRLIMARTIVADPFVPQHLTDALGETTRTANRLQHLQKKLLSDRAKQDRLDVAAAKAAQEKAEVAAQEALSRASSAEVRVTHLEQELEWLKTYMKSLEQQRDAAHKALRKVREALSADRADPDASSTHRLSNFSPGGSCVSEHESNGAA